MNDDKLITMWRRSNISSFTTFKGGILMTLDVSSLRNALTGKMSCLSILLALLLLIGCSNSLDEKRIKANASFAMGDKLMCTLVQSSDKKDIGKNLTFIGLNSAQPKVLFENGILYHFKKIFENERTLSMVLATTVLGTAKTGGIDSFVIDKKTGKFSRVSAGLIELPGSGVFSIASLGVCK